MNVVCSGHIWALMFACAAFLASQLHSCEDRGIVVDGKSPTDDPFTAAFTTKGNGDVVEARGGEFMVDLQTDERDVGRDLLKWGWYRPEKESVIPHYDEDRFKHFCAASAMYAGIGGDAIRQRFYSKWGYKEATTEWTGHIYNLTLTNVYLNITSSQIERASCSGTRILVNSKPAEWLDAHYEGQWETLAVHRFDIDLKLLVDESDYEDMFHDLIANISFDVDNSRCFKKYDFYYEIYCNKNEALKLKNKSAMWQTIPQDSTSLVCSDGSDDSKKYQCGTNVIEMLPTMEDGATVNASLCRYVANYNFFQVKTLRNRQDMSLAACRNCHKICAR